MKKFYLTTAIPYVNAKPHIGHALEFVQTDIIKRFHKINGDDTLLLSGGDENALKNVQAAEQENIPVQKLVDKNSQLFFDLAKRLNIEFDVFQKGSDKKHHLSSQKLWNLCFENGDIYKKKYTGLYCLGCEAFYDKEELNERGECSEHPGKKLEEISEENYFFKLSKYQNQLEKLIILGDLKIIPESRKNEALGFIKQGLKDISVSRSNKRAKNWGVEVPNDKNQRIYVWFDALNIYQSGIGFGHNEELYKKWWPADLHVIGKGILRFHAIYWPAFLISAGLKLPKTIFIHGYLTVNGQKMSKSIGNVIDPIEIIEKYGTDALRYYLASQISPFEDGDFTIEKFEKTYNTDLANGLGNLVARVAKLAEKKNIYIKAISRTTAGIENRIVHWIPDPSLESEYVEKINQYKFNEVLSLVWRQITDLDRKINEIKPWEENKESEIFLADDAVLRIRDIAQLLKPFLPETAEKIEEQFKGPKIVVQKPLFPRL